MAIRKRTGRAKPWECYWRNPVTGKIESESFATKQDAEKKDSLIRHQLKFERESFQREEPEREIKQITLEQAYLAYLQEKQFSRHNLAAQVSSMRPVLLLIGTQKLEDINREILETTMAKMSGNVKQVTIRNRMRILRTVLRWSAERGLCKSPAFPRLPPASYEHFIPPTPEELAAIIQVAPPHIQRVIILGSQIGARVGQSELFRLTWQDVDLSQGIIRIHGARKNYAAPWREVPVRESLLPIMANWAKMDLMAGISHIIHYKNNPVQSIKTAWAASLKRAGITRRIRPYDLRHAFATELIAAGSDIGTVAKLMGHSTPVMLLNHYQYVMDRQKRSAVESLPDVACMAKLYGQNERHLAE